MAQITTLDTVSKLLKYVTITLPPFVTKSDDSYIRQFLSSILEVFKINIDQLNQMFNNTFISEAEEGDLEKLILDVSNVTRKDGETDEDYRNRFYKYVYRYNATANSIEEIVYDTLGYYPIKLTESGARTAYWGLHDLVEEDRVANSAYFYDDVNEYTAYWGRYQSQQSSENEKYFVGIIHLTERPPQEKLDELCDVIERVRKKGTKIYLQFLDNIDIILEPVVTIVEEDAFTFTWRLVPSAFSYEVQIDDDPLFGSPTTYITSSTSYSFSGLSGGVTYYTRVRYENDDGYSEWTEPVETTTSSSIGTPIATEETDVDPYGFTANWGSVVGATSYLLTASANNDLSSPISGLNQLNVGNVVSYDINKITEERMLYMKSVSSVFQIFSSKLDGTDIQQHTNVSVAINDAIYLPNSDIVYSKTNGSQYKLYRINKSESYATEHELLDNLNNPLTLHNYYLGSSHDGNYLVYIKESPPTTSNLYEYNINTRVETQLTSGDPPFSYSPQYDRADENIYYSSGTFASTLYINKYNRSLASNTMLNTVSKSIFNTVDSDNNYLYYAQFTTFPNLIIKKFNISTEISTDIVTIGNTYFSNIFLNFDENKLYFTNDRSPHSGKYKIYRCNLDGSNQEIVLGSLDSENYVICDVKKVTYGISIFPTIPPLSTLYYGVKATDGANTSPYSNIIMVNKPI